MEWICSAGGPLILLSQPLLDCWHGGFGREGETDYDRACQIYDYIGIIPVDGGYGLVLGDEPNQTAWLPAESSGAGTLVRWVFASSESDSIQQARALPDDAFQITGLEFVTEHPTHVLFDSALPGSRYQEGGFLKIVLAPGRYAVSTAVYAPDAETSMILHRVCSKDRI